MKNTILFYLLSLIWGLPMSLIGMFAALVLICMGCKPSKWGPCLCFTVGNNWGGVSLGFVIVVCEEASASIKNHEFGHCIQNCCFGPLMPFVICIPSFIRYWYFMIRRHFKLKIKKAYDSIWFEAGATKLGNLHMSKW